MKYLGEYQGTGIREATLCRNSEGPHDVKWLLQSVAATKELPAPPVRLPVRFTLWNEFLRTVFERAQRPGG